jgi:hypothetical protein
MGTTAYLKSANSDGLLTASGARLVLSYAAARFVLRGCFRIQNLALRGYELYRGVDALPDLAGAPYETFATLPHTTPAQDAGHTYNYVLRYRNAYDLVSQNMQAQEYVVNADGSLGLFPLAPAEIRAESAAAGAARILAAYDYDAEPAGVAADYWLIWVTSDGSTPDPTAEPTAIIAMVQADGMARLDSLSAAYGAGADLKILVRVRRATSAGGATGVDSQNATPITCARDVDGPAAPAVLKFHGQAARAL